MMRSRALNRVVLTGSESVGKTQLAAELATHFGVLCVPEYAREYAVAKGAPLELADVDGIAHGQIALEDAFTEQARAAGHPLLVQDTDLVSTVVYSTHYFGQCPPHLLDAAYTRRARLYLLLDIDVPWIPDGVRDRGDRREDMQALFARTLAQVEANVVPLQGSWDRRFHDAVTTISTLLRE